MKKKIAIITAGLATAMIFAYFVISRNNPQDIQHIILISIDTCRADYLSCYGYPRKTTPHIDAFAEGATRFEKVVSPVPETLPAHCSMLTGTIPPRHGVHQNIGFYLNASALTLPEILKQNDYQTGAIISAFVLDGKLGLAQGFDTYHDTFMDGSYNIGIAGNERKGDETTRLAINWLKRHQDSKSFLFLHYYDPHTDYAPPEPFETDFADNPYAGEIAFTDHCIGQVIQALKELKMYDSSLLIITGDHGEMLGEHGEQTHGYFIYESAIKVPLIVKLPGQKKGITIKEPVGLIDLVPTICSLLAISAPTTFDGEDISNFLKGIPPESYERYIYSESGTPNEIGAGWLLGVSTEHWKYIKAPRPELYDLQADPSENNNLVEQEHHRARILEDKLLEIVETTARKDSESRVTLDEETIKRLESLGYVSGGSTETFSLSVSEHDPKDLIHVLEEYKRAHRYFNENDYETASMLAQPLLLQCPHFSKPYYLLGDIKMKQGLFDQAIGYYRQGRNIDPRRLKDISLLNTLAWLQATRPLLMSRDVDEALAYAKQVCVETNYENANLLDTLGAAYAACGDFPNAIETARKAKSIAQATNNLRLAKKIEARLKLYEQSKPYIEE